VRHEIQVERELLGGQPLVERENVAPLQRGDEVVGVLDAGLDRRELDQLPDVVAGEPGIELFGRDGRVDGHGSARRTKRRPKLFDRDGSAQNENRTHIGTLSVGSTLSRRMYVLPFWSGIRKYGRPVRGVTLM
jgi:hypothetical protein